ncbi:hypothetical protein [Tritonibacter mobilis]|uniref:hypothetical protein n=1 Tax=Tritonibacter mobilis TaxID=379347 RepID=UPI00039ECB78|nr:hypothetical protein [Tritonibacter mobilis]
MTVPALMKIEDAALELGVPKASLKTAALEHGFLIRMGRCIRIDRNDFPKLVKACRDQAKVPASTNSNTAHTGTSEIPASPTGQRAAQAANKLKKRLPPTSPPKGGKVLPMNRQT